MDVMWIATDPDSSGGSHIPNGVPAQMTTSRGSRPCFATGEGYSEVHRADQQYPLLTLLLKDGYGVIHEFASEDKVLLLVGDGGFSLDVLWRRSWRDSPEARGAAVRFLRAGLGVRQVAKGRAGAGARHGRRPDLRRRGRHRRRPRARRAGPDAELFLYPGDQHYFADSSLPSYDAEATAMLTQRVLDFLGARERLGRADKGLLSAFTGAVEGTWELARRCEPAHPTGPRSLPGFQAGS